MFVSFITYFCLVSIFLMVTISNQVIIKLKKYEIHKYNIHSKNLKNENFVMPERNFSDQDQGSALTKKLIYSIYKDL